MKQRLIILSDLWGIQKSDWIEVYICLLTEKYEVIYYDCCELGKVDTSIYIQDNLHQQFLKNGIEVAAKRLLELEEGKVNILAFSIGGVIAWKAGLYGLKIDNLYGISCTRLRHETQKPKGNLKLYYGSEDKFIPERDWFKELSISNYIINNQNHEVYKQAEFANEICQEINDAVC